MSEEQRSIDTERIVEEDLVAITAGLGETADRLAGKTILISGGAGFLGSYLTATFQHLNASLREPCRVIVLDNYITGSPRNLICTIHDPRIGFHRHDIREPVEIPEEIDLVLHMAGVASPKYYRKFPLETIEAAVWGSKNLLELARAKRPRSFVFFSSSEIYGDPDPGNVPTKETYRGHVSSIGPRACYDESKRLSETLCITYFEQFDVPVKIVRPFNVYGPGMKPDDFRVVPAFLMSALLSRPLRVYGDGLQTRTFCYVTDAITGFLKVLLSDRNGEVYNVGTDRDEIGMADLARLVLEVTGRPGPVEVIPHPESYPKDEPQRRMPDVTKLREALGYDPLVDLPTGLRRTYAWLSARYADWRPPSDAA